MSGVTVKVSCVPGLGPRIRMDAKVVATVKRGAAFYAAKVKRNLYPLTASGMFRVTKESTLNPSTISMTRASVHVIVNPTGITPPPPRPSGDSGFHWS